MGPDDGGRELAVALSGASAAPCLSAQGVRRRIGETLASSIVAPRPDAHAAVDMQVSIERVSEGWAARIELKGRRGTIRHRELTIEHDSCAELENAVVLVGALLFDDLWAEEATRASVEPPAPQVLVVPPAPAEPASGPRWRVFSGVFGAFGYGDLPGPTAGAGLSVDFAAPRVSMIGLSARAWPLSRRRDEIGRGARFSAYEAGASFCARAVERPRAWLFPCLGARGGVTYATALGLDRAEAVVRPRALVEATLAVRVLVSDPLWLGIGAGLGIPLVRDRFRYEDAEGVIVQIHRAWPLVPLAHLEIALASVLGGPAARSGLRAQPARPPS